MAENKTGKIEDFLPINSIEEGLITYQGGIYARMLKVGGVNLAYLSSEEQVFKIRQLSNIFRDVDSQVSIVKLETPLDLKTNIEKQEKLLNVQRKNFENKVIKSAENYENRLYQINIEKEVLNFYQNDEPFLINEFYIIMYNRNIQVLNHEYEQTYFSFIQASLDPIKLNDIKIKTFLYNFFNPLDKINERTHKRIERSNENFKKIVLPSRLEIGKNKIITDKMVANISSIYNYPLEVAGGWLSHIVNSSNTSCVINIRYVHESDARKMMDKAITEIRTRMIRRKSATQSESENIQLQSYYDIINSITSGNEALKQVHVLIMGYADSEEKLKDLNRQLKSDAKKNNVKLDNLNYRQMEGFIAMLPTPRDDIINSNGIDMPSTTLGAGFPFVFQNLTDPDGFLLGYNNSSLVFWDPKTRSSSRANSNIMVIGKSGSGKSHFTKKMILKLILEGVKIYIVDPDGEYNIITKKMGGERIDVGAGVNSRVNPFHIFGEMEEDDDNSGESLDAGNRAIFSNHIQFMEQFFQNLVPSLTDKEISRLSKLIMETYYNKKIYDDTNFLELKATDFPIMDDLLKTIHNKRDLLLKEITKYPERNIDLNDELIDLRNVEVYVGRLATGGSLANLWNGPTTIDTKNSDLIHFDFKKTASSKNDRVMNVQMMLVLRFLENEVSKNRERNLARKENNYIAIVVDEAHVFIDEKAPAALYFMFQMVKRIRKYNGIFVVITQNVNDFVGSDSIKKYTTAIVNGCQYSFVFGLNPHDLQALMDLYESVGGFSEEERLFVGSAGIGQCLFIVSPGQRIIMEKITISKEEEIAFK